MRILSVVAVSRLAERIACQVGGHIDRDELLARLGALDVDDQRAAAGIGLAVVVGRLEALESETGPVLHVCRPQSVAAPTAHHTTGGTAA